jgi:hypothetical protein
MNPQRTITVLGVAVPDAFTDIEGIPHPNWQSILAAVPENASDNQQHTAMQEATRQWLKALAAALPDLYLIEETGNFILLLPAHSKLVSSLPGFCESALKSLTETLQGFLTEEGHGKHVALVFDNIDSYASYLAPFHPEEGTHRLADAMCLKKDYYHIVIGPSHGENSNYPLFHELVHLLLSCYPMPMWLEEGIIKLLEAQFWQRPVHLDDRTVKLHRRHWNDETIQQFWSGKSFGIPGNLSMLSYSLADVIVSLIQSHSKYLLDFMAAAQWEDAGQSAAIEHLGLPLGEIVGMFLGDGAWNPRSPSQTTKS